MHAPLLPSTQEGSTEVRGTSSAQRGRSSGGNSEKASKTTIGLVFTAFCVIRALDRVFNKRVQDRMVNYQLMYINVFWPIGVQLMTIILCMCYVLQQNRAHPGTYDYTFFLPNSKFVSKNGAYPQWRLGLFSFWDELNAVGTSLPGPYISLTLQSIMTNFNVVWTVVISMFYLKARYSQIHFIGCFLIILSGLVSITVELQTGKGLNEYKSASGNMLETSSLWYIIYIVGTIPAGISNCYKEKVLKSQKLDIMYASLWSGYWQIFWGLLMFPINWIRMPTPAVYNAPGDTLGYVSDTWTCFWGVAPDPTNEQDMACESAGGSAAVWFGVYLLFNVAFNVLMLWLTKEMSATWATIGTVLCLDLTALFSMSKTLMGDEAEPVTLEQYFGLILAGVGMYIYSIVDEDDSHWEKHNRGEEGEEDEGAEEGGEGRSSMQIADISMGSERSSSFAAMWRANSVNNQRFRVSGEGLGVRVSRSSRSRSSRAREQSAQF